MDGDSDLGSETVHKFLLVYGDAILSPLLPTSLYGETFGSVLLGLLLYKTSSHLDFRDSLREISVLPPNSMHFRNRVHMLHYFIV